MIIYPHRPPDESQRLKLNHVYKCLGCRRFWLGQQLDKKNGKRSCHDCTMDVQDITFTKDAQAYLYFAGLVQTPPW